MPVSHFTKEYYKDLYDNSPDLIVVGNPITGKILDCNNTFLKKTGYTKEEVLALPDIKAVYYPDCLDNLESAHRSVITKGKIKNAVLILRTKHNTPLHVAMSATSIIDKNGEYNLVRIAYRDISELKKAEEMILNKNQELDKKNDELKNFVYLLSHDLKAPLRILNSLAYFLQDLPDRNTTEALNYITKIKEQAAKANMLIEDSIKYFMRKEKEMNLERIDIASLIEEVSTTVTDYQPGKVELDSKIKYIISAKLALRQILYNLINNAFVHHFDLSKAKVLIKVREIEGNYIIEVSDNGPGIKPEMHERIFTPFYQLKNTQKAANDGLGLTIVKQLVQTLQGEILVNSEIGKGATFIIKFPKLAS